jgi:hypothetical protein
MGIAENGCCVPFSREYSRGEPVAIDPVDWTPDQTRDAGRVRFSIETDTSPFVGLMRSVDEIRGRFSDDNKPSRGAVLEAFVYYGRASESEAVVEKLASEGFSRD